MSPRGRVLAGVALSLLLVIYVVTHRASPGHENLGLDHALGLGVHCPEPKHADVVLSPQYEIMKHEEDPDSEIVWQVPELPAPVGVLLLFHGCTRGSVDFWPHDHGCLRCVGYPAEVEITKAALARGLALLAISSHYKQCWGPKDVRPAAAVATRWASAHGLNQLPFYALGASSGGSFAPRLAEHLNKNTSVGAPRVRGLELQIMAAGLLVPGVTKVAMTHMPRDVSTAAAVAADLKALQEAGTLVLENRADPLALSKSFMCERISTIDDVQSAAVYDALDQAGLLGADFKLTSDPRQGDWATAIDNAPDLDLDQEDALRVSEALNTAWAQHEFTGDFVEKTLDFLLQAPNVR